MKGLKALKTRAVNTNPRACPPPVVEAPKIKVIETIVTEEKSFKKSKQTFKQSAGSKFNEQEKNTDSK